MWNRQLAQPVFNDIKNIIKLRVGQLNLLRRYTTTWQLFIQSHPILGGIGFATGQARPRPKDDMRHQR